MKNQKISLKVWMLIKIVPALLLLLYYWMCVRTDYKPIYTYLQYALLGCMGVCLVIFKMKRDIFDECAQEILSKTDSICFKLSYVIFGILILACVFINTSSSSIVIGYGIVGGLVILTILRSIIFCVLDARWM